MAADELERAHRNLVDSSRQLFALDPGAELEAEPGWLFGAGSSSHPAIANIALRRDDAIEGAELIARAGEFFTARGRRFTVWARLGRAEDDDLAAAAEAAGFQAVYEMPEMLLRGGRLEPEPLASGAQLHRLAEESEGPDFWAVAKDAYVTNGFPPEVFSYTDHAGLLADNVVAFVARVDGRPVSIAMTIVSDAVAGIYWVGSRESARGLGLGRAVTVAATNAGFELGANVAALQASPMGRPIYAKLGYEAVYDYRLLISPQP